MTTSGSTMAAITSFVGKSYTVNILNLKQKFEQSLSTIKDKISNNMELYDNMLVKYGQMEIKIL